MIRVLSLVSLCALMGLSVACGGDDEQDTPTPGTGSSGQTGSSSGDGTDPGSSSGQNGSSSSGSQPQSCVETPFEYPAAKPALDADKYSDFLTLSAAAPFEVIGVYESPLDLAGATPLWQPHGGGLLVSTVDFTTGDVSAHLLTVTGDVAEGTLVDTAKELAAPADLPAGSFANYPPVVPLAAEHAYLLGYTGGAADGFPSVAYHFGAGANTLRYQARALFAATAQAKNDNEQRWFLSSFSPLATELPESGQPGIYVNDTCEGGKLTAACTAGFTLLSLPSGVNSGPLALDAHGTLVASHYDGGAGAISVQALGPCEASTATTTQTGSAVATFAGIGTSGLAALPGDAARGGLLLHVPMDAAEYVGKQVDLVELSRLGSGGFDGADPLWSVLGLGPAGESLNVVADDAGYLWVTVATNGGSDYVLKLQRK